MTRHQRPDEVIQQRQATPAQAYPNPSSASGPEAKPRRRQWLPHPLLTLALAVVWLLLNNSLAPGQIALGLLLGWLIPFFAIAYWPDPVRVHRPLKLLRFCAMVLTDIVVANLRVAALVLGGPRRLHPAFVVVPLDLASEFAVAVLANTVCLTPGTVSAKLSDDQRYLLIHALDNEHSDELVAEIKSRYEQPLKEIFEC